MGLVEPASKMKHIIPSGIISFNFAADDPQSYSALKVGG
jgi:hypothetical protein